MLKMSGIEFLGFIVNKYFNIIRIILIGYMDVEDLVEVINFGRVFKYVIKFWDDDEFKVLVK